MQRHREQTAHLQQAAMLHSRSRSARCKTLGSWRAATGGVRATAGSVISPISRIRQRSNPPAVGAKITRYENPAEPTPVPLVNVRDAREIGYWPASLAHIHSLRSAYEYFPHNNISARTFPIGLRLRAKHRGTQSKSARHVKAAIIELHGAAKFICEGRKHGVPDLQPQELL